MTINKLISNLNIDNAENSIIYVCGNSHTYKIGQTTRPACCRMAEIRKIDKDIQLYGYIQFKANKPMRDLIESVLRLHMHNLGYTLQGNDHFQKKGHYKTFKSQAFDIITTTLNDFNIDYIVVNK